MKNGVNLKRCHFFTFGDGTLLHQSAALRLYISAKNSGWFESVRFYGAGTLRTFESFVRAHAEFIQSNPRGFGYYVWKPFLFLKRLESLKEGDSLLYLDAGCELNLLGHRRFLKYLEATYDTELLGFRIDEKIAKWTKADLLHFFGVENDFGVLDECQREAGVLFAVNTKKTRQFFREWYLISIAENYRFVNDVGSIRQESAHFKEHRHDQSIFTLLTLDRKYGHFPINENYFPSCWEHNWHPCEFPFATMRNISGATRLNPNAQVSVQTPAVFSHLTAECSITSSIFGEQL